jgi:hypothetical protein
MAMPMEVKAGSSCGTDIGIVCRAPRPENAPQSGSPSPSLRCSRTNPGVREPLRPSCSSKVG